MSSRQVWSCQLKACIGSAPRRSSGLVVSIPSFYSDNPSSNPIDIEIIFPLVRRDEKKRKKEAGYWHRKQPCIFESFGE